MKLIAVSLFALLALAGPAWAAEGGNSQGWDFFLRTINFLVFLAILVFLLRKPLGKALRGRQEGIKEELATLEANREEAARTKAEAAALLSHAEEESKRLLAEYRAQAEQERTRILEQAAQQVTRLHEQAQLTIARELAQAQARLQDELSLAALSRAEAMLRKQITSQDQARLSEEFLANLAQTRVGGQ